MNKPSKKFLFLFGLLICNHIFAFGNKYAGSFLKTGTGVREISLGGATIASSNMTSAFYWNPALLSETTRITGRIMHSEEFGGALNLDHISFAMPVKNGLKLGIGFIRSSVDNIPLVKESSLIDIGNDGIGPNDDDYRGPDTDGSEGNGKLDKNERLDFGKIGKFGSSESAFFISAAKKYNKKIAIGLSVKTLYKDLHRNGAFGLGLDAGLTYYLSDKIKLAAQLTDFTTTFLFWDDGKKETITPELRLGGSYLYKIEIFDISVEPMLGINISAEGKQNNSLLESSLTNIKLNTGLEVIINAKLALRAGRDENEGMHLGLGLNTSIININYGLSLGGAYKSLGNSHQVGLIFDIPKVMSLVKNHI